MDYNQYMYLNSMSDLERRWQAALYEILSLKETHQVTTNSTIKMLQEKLNQQEKIIREKDIEIDGLKKTVEELTVAVDSATSANKTILEISEREIEENAIKRKHEMKCQIKLMEDMNTRHNISIQKLTEGARTVLQDLESQLEETKINESHLLKKISEFEESKVKNERHLKDWGQVSDKMTKELSDVKNKLESSKFANSKLKEEIALWKKYCEKAEDERKAIVKCDDKNDINVKKLNQIVSLIESDQKQNGYMLDALNRFQNSIIECISSFDFIKKVPVTLSSVESQTEDTKYCEITTNHREIEQLRKKEKRQEEDLKKFEIEMNNLIQQNITLREVIKSMKYARDEQEKEHHEHEVTVTKLENSVMLLKNSIMNDKKNVTVGRSFRRKK